MAANPGQVEHQRGRAVEEEIGREHELERQHRHRQHPPAELNHLNEHPQNGAVDFRNQEMPPGGRLEHAANGTLAAVQIPAQEPHQRFDRNAPLRGPRVIPERPVYEAVTEDIVLPWSGGREMIEFAASLVPLEF